MSRKSAREDAFKRIYAALVTGGDDGTTAETLYAGHTEEECRYMDDVVAAADGDFAFLRHVIEKYAAGFAFDRIYKVDCAILLLAVSEILFTDVPDKAAANEAVELAKAYSTERSAAFINGILASVIRDKDKLSAEAETYGEESGADETAETNDTEADNGTDN